MRKTIFLSLISCVMAMGQTAKPRIAVQTFENPPSFAQSNIGNALTEIVTTELAKYGRYQIVDRQVVAELMKEIQFGQTDHAASTTFAAKGGFKGAEFLLAGKVTNFGFQERQGQQTVRDRQGEHLVIVYQQVADVRIDFRFVNVKTTDVILSESASDRQTNTSAAAYYPTWVGLVRKAGFSISELQGSIMAKATEEAVKKLVRKLADLSSEVGSYTQSDAASKRLESVGQATGTILADAGQDTFVVSLGAKDGLLAGDRFKVFAERAVKNSKGEVIFKEKQEIATLQAKDTSSAADRSTAMLLNVSGARKPQEGDAVSIDRQSPAATGVATAPTASVATPPARGDNTASIAGTPAPAAADGLVKQGDRYYEDGYFNQAVEQYEKAVKLSPNSAAILNRLAVAYVRNKALLQAETTWERIIQSGMTASIPASHLHGMGSCSGDLQITSSMVTFSATAGDHSFRTPRPGMSAELRRDRIEIRVPAQAGKEAKYTIAPAVLNLVDSRPALWRRRVVEGEPDSPADQMKLTKVLIRLIGAQALDAQ
jgi:curli biogenesis system outer membrane secretion channel CsgG